MACKCRNRQAGKNIPHTIRPGDSCIFCAEKHMGLALSCLVANGLKPVARQEVIGELELARRHTFISYPDIAKYISVAILAAVFRMELTEVATRVEKAAAEVSSLVDKAENGEDITPAVYVPGTGVPAAATPFAGELFFSAGWRLACECNYWGENKALMIGDLAAAQYHIFRWNKEISDKIRDIRHTVQKLHSQQIDPIWAEVASDIDNSISPVAIDIANKYGTDLSWYLDR